MSKTPSLKFTLPGEMVAALERVRVNGDFTTLREAVWAVFEIGLDRVATDGIRRGVARQMRREMRMWMLSEMGRAVRDIEQRLEEAFAQPSVAEEDLLDENQS